MKNTLEQECLEHRIKLVLARSSGSCVKMKNKKKQEQFHQRLMASSRKRKKLIFVVVEFILAIFKKTSGKVSCLCVII